MQGVVWVLRVTASSTITEGPPAARHRRLLRLQQLLLSNPAPSTCMLIRRYLALPSSPYHVNYLPIVGGQRVHAVPRPPPPPSIPTTVSLPFLDLTAMTVYT